MSDTDLIKSLTGSSRLEESKRRAFIQTSIGFAVALGLYAVVMRFVLPGFPLGNWIGLFAALSYLGLAYAAHRMRTLAAPAAAFVTISIAGILATTMISGGVDDFTAPFFVAVPVISGFFLGARGAFFAGVATIAAVCGLAAIDAAGLVVDSPYPQDVFELASAAVLATSIALTMMTAHLFTARAAEHAASIEQSNALLSAFARTAPIAVAMFDRDIRYIEVSDRWLTDYGLTREEVIGRSHYEVFPEIPQAWKDAHRRCLAGATERSEADLFRRADGSEQWLLWEVQPWRDAKADIGGIIMISRDITEQIRAQETLKAAKRQALETSKAKSAFLAAMSHEIRTPLNAVIGLTEALLDAGLDARQRKLVAEANRSGEHLLALISDVLDLSKLEAGKMALDPVRFSVTELVSSVAGMFASAAEQKGLVLETTVAPNVREEVTADEKRLRQILVNLVGNALKFTESGRIDIRVRTGALNTDDSSAELLIDVADTGVGIAPDRAPTLFEAFTQADASVARRFGGTGLGLAICRKLLDEMGGEISCESAPGEGSTFRVRLPVKLAPGASAAPRDAGAAQAEGVLQGLHILFADDNAGNRLVYEEMAKKLGCTARIVASGREAAAACGRETFDAVIMDIEMADMDGIEATKAIRALDAPASAVPIIAATAHALRGDRERFLAAGMNDYLAKPISRRVLAETLIRARGGRNGEAADDKPASDESGLLNVDVVSDLAALSAAGRSAGLFGELWDSLAETIEALEKAGPDGDPALVRKLAHDACGLSANLGASALSAALRSLEQAARDETATPDLFDGLARLGGASREAAEAFMARRAAAN